MPTHYLWKNIGFWKVLPQLQSHLWPSALAQPLRDISEPMGESSHLSITEFETYCSFSHGFDFLSYSSFLDFSHEKLCWQKKKSLLESSHFSIILLLNIRNKSKGIFIHLRGESTWVFPSSIREETAVWLSEPGRACLWLEIDRTLWIRRQFLSFLLHSSFLFLSKQNLRNRVVLTVRWKKKYWGRSGCADVKRC